MIKVGKIYTLAIVGLASIVLSGCTPPTPEEQAAYKLKQQQKAQCKEAFKNCIVENSYNRDMSNVHVSMQVTNYCQRSYPCYR